MSLEYERKSKSIVQELIIELPELFSFDFVVVVCIGIDEEILPLFVVETLSKLIPQKSNELLLV
jgi:DeoR/GlpR family transcriptional regulator of sugar metabolism